MSKIPQEPITDEKLAEIGSLLPPGVLERIERNRHYIARLEAEIERLCAEVAAAERRGTEKMREIAAEIARGELSGDDKPASHAREKVTEWLSYPAVKAAAHRRDVMPVFVPTHRHVKRGSLYRVIGEAEAQVSTGQSCDSVSVRKSVSWHTRLIKDGDRLTIYQSEDGKLWARFSDEFNDGRFEVLGVTNGNNDL